MKDFQALNRVTRENVLFTLQTRVIRILFLFTSSSEGK